jgi:hypothetical protein
MAQILDPLPNDDKKVLLCCYVNATSQIQIARITNIPNWYFERVVFPGQRLVFESVSEGLLEIHTGMMASAILSDRIPCERLVINSDPVTENQENQEDLNQNLSQSVVESIVENTDIYQDNNTVELKEKQILKSDYSLNDSVEMVKNMATLSVISSFA